MWHLAIQEGQLEDVRKSAQEEEVTSRKYLREQAAKQLRKEEEASEKIKRNRLLRVRWVARTCQGTCCFLVTSLPVVLPEPRPWPESPCDPLLSDLNIHFSFPSLLWLLPEAQAPLPRCSSCPAAS